MTFELSVCRALDSFFANEMIVYCLYVEINKLMKDWGSKLCF